MLEAVLNVLAIGLPDLLGEGIISGVARLTRGRWESAFVSDRPRAEAAAHRLTHARIGCWLRTTGRSGTTHVMVRSKRMPEARRILGLA